MTYDGAAKYTDKHTNYNISDTIAIVVPEHVYTAMFLRALSLIDEKYNVFSMNCVQYICTILGIKKLFLPDSLYNYLTNRANNGIIYLI